MDTTPEVTPGPDNERWKRVQRWRKLSEHLHARTPMTDGESGPFIDAFISGYDEYPWALPAVEPEKVQQLLVAVLHPREHSAGAAFTAFERGIALRKLVEECVAAALNAHHPHPGTESGEDE